MKKRLYLIAAAALALVACAKEEAYQPTESTIPGAKRIVLGASFELPGDPTKSDYDAAGNFTWSDDDAILIGSDGTSGDKNWGGGSIIAGQSEIGPGYATAQFDCTLIGGDVTAIAAVFPNTVKPSYSAGTLSLTLPATIAWTDTQLANPANATMQVDNIMVARYVDIYSEGYAHGKTEGIQFHNVGGLFCLTLKNVPAGADKLVFTADKKINGTFAVSNVVDSTDHNNYPVIATAATETKSEKSVTITFPTITNGENKMTFFIPVPVGSYVIGFDVQNAEAKSLWAFSASRENGVERGHIVKMPTLSHVIVGGSGDGATNIITTPSGFSGTVNLPSTNNSIYVRMNQTGGAITLAYSDAPALHPANVYLQALGNVETLDINLPDSHVELTGVDDVTNVITNVSSYTSYSTLKVDKKVKIGKDEDVNSGITITGGSLDLAAPVDGKVIVNIPPDNNNETEEKVAINITSAIKDLVVTRAADNVTPADKVYVSLSSGASVAKTISVPEVNCNLYVAPGVAVSVIDTKAAENTVEGQVDTLSATGASTIVTVTKKATVTSSITADDGATVIVDENATTTGATQNDNEGAGTISSVDLSSVVAYIGGKTYTTLTAAFAAAQDGDIVKLAKDYDATSEGMSGDTRQFVINKSLTIDGQGYTVTTKKRGFGVGNVNNDLSSNIDVTFKDITIKNTTSEARCIDTRGKIGTLTLDGVNLSTDGAPGGYTQPLTIGGNQSTTADVIIKNSVIETNVEGTASYYAIITFNPVAMNISNSTLKGWACIYAKGPSSSAGSNGSVFNIDKCNIISKNPYSGKTNAFAALIIEAPSANNVKINVTNSEIEIYALGDQKQFISGNGYPMANGGVFLGEGNTVTLTGDHAAFNNLYYLENGDYSPALYITGGTFNVDPTPHVADGYKAVDNGDGTWTVEVDTNVYAAKIGYTKYETLNAAIAAANGMDDATITLLSDVTEAECWTATKSMTLDLNGYTYTNTAVPTIVPTNTKKAASNYKTQMLVAPTANCTFTIDATKGGKIVAAPTSAGTNGDIGLCVADKVLNGTPQYSDITIKLIINGLNAETTVFESNDKIKYDVLTAFRNKESRMNVSNAKFVHAKSGAGVDLYMEGIGTANLNNVAVVTPQCEGVCIGDSTNNEGDNHAVGNFTNCNIKNTFTGSAEWNYVAINATSGAEVNVYSGTYEGPAVASVATSGGTINFYGGTLKGNKIRFITTGTSGYSWASTAIYYDPSSCTFTGSTEDTVVKGDIVAPFVAQIGETKYATLAEAVSAASENGNVKIINAGKYSIPAITKNLTIEAAVSGVVVEHTTNTTIANIESGKTATFKNITFNLGDISTATAHGFGTLNGTNGSLVMNGCTINGALNLFGESSFDNCAFSASGIYNIWAVNNDATFKGCSFTNTNRAVNVYDQKHGSTEKNVSFSSCTFVSTGTTPKKAAINIHDNPDNQAEGAKYNVTINDCTTTGTWAESVAQTGEPANATVCNNALWMVSDIVDWANGNITVTVDAAAQDVYKVPVAQIGSSYYATLAEAVTAAQSGDTIVILSDFTLEGNAGVTIPAGKDVTIDLNGRTIKNLVNADANSQLIVNRGTLTITDSSAGANGTMTNEIASGVHTGAWTNYNYYTNIITNFGTLTINAGNLTQVATTNISYVIDNLGANSSVTINGGSLTAGYIPIRAYNATTSVTIHGGSLSGLFDLYLQLTTTLVIDGGTFSAPTRSIIYVDAASNISISGNPVFTNGTDRKFIEFDTDAVKDASTLSVTGGTYNTDPSEYVAPGYEAVQYGNNWNVQVKTTPEMWIDNAASTYESVDETNKIITISTAAQLAKLAKDIQDNDAKPSTFEYKGWTFKLTSDIDLSGKIWTPIGADLTNYYEASFRGTFDGDGHKITNMHAVANRWAGLFGPIHSGMEVIIKDLTIEHFVVESNHYAGAIVGWIEQANPAVTISGCVVNQGTITSTPELIGTSYDNGDKAGGICGYIVKATSSAAEVSIVGNTVSNVDITAYRDLGGLLGHAANVTTLSKNTVSNVNIYQNNTNAYKPSVTTYGPIIGRIVNTDIPENNTTTNVKIYTGTPGSYNIVE